jgi:hypothetical protein
LGLDLPHQLLVSQARIDRYRIQAPSSGKPLPSHRALVDTVPEEAQTAPRHFAPKRDIDFRD